MAHETERTPQVILRVNDLERSLEFYERLPGFSRAWRQGGAARVTGPGGVPVLLAVPPADLPAWQGVPEAGPGALVYLHRPDLPQLARELGTAPPVTPYPGNRHLLLPDPDGYVLAFWEYLSLTDAHLLDLFRTGPDRLRAALASIGESGLDLPWAPGKWTVRQVVHHLVDSDLATFQVIRMALALPGRQITADLWNPDDWMAGLDCARRPIGPAVALFEAARAWVLETVTHLPDGLDRTVSWPSGYTAQVRDLLRQVGGHALHHIIQIEADFTSKKEPNGPLPDS